MRFQKDSAVALSFTFKSYHERKRGLVYRLNNHRNVIKKEQDVAMISQSLVLKPKLQGASVGTRPKYCFDQDRRLWKLSRLLVHSQTLFYLRLSLNIRSEEAIEIPLKIGNFNPTS